MPQQTNTASLASSLTAIKALLAKPVEFEDFLTKLGPKGRVHVERHLAVAETESARVTPPPGDGWLAQ